MAQCPGMREKRVVIDLYDDIDGTPNATTATFMLNGKSYEIELGDKNLAKLKKALDPYVKAGREIRPKKRRSEPKAADVRAWAAEHGIEVPATGKVAQDVIEQYKAAN